MSYSAKLGYAKDRMHLVLQELGDAQAGRRQDAPTAMTVAKAVDELNKAWDELTDCLVRQRDERDRHLRDLMDELAEARKR